MISHFVAVAVIIESYLPEKNCTYLLFFLSFSLREGEEIFEKEL